MYCGANNHAVHVQATGTTCNVTVFDVNNPLSVALNPTKPCDHSVYNKTCTAFQGALLIDISPALGQDGQLLKQQNPDVQVLITLPLHCAPQSLMPETARSFIGA